MANARLIALALAGTATPALAGEVVNAGVPRVDSQAMAILQAAAPQGDALAQGRAMLAAGNAVQAISAFRAALAADPASVAALNGLGVAYDRMGRADLARQ